MRRDACGNRLVPGYNVDKVNIAAGLALAARFGYDSAEHQMVVTYALQRQVRGEEAGAERTALSGGIDLTSWYAIKAEAIVAANETNTVRKLELPAELAQRVVDDIDAMGNDAPLSLKMLWGHLQS
jgi:hypothetical protein